MADTTLYARLNTKGLMTGEVATSPPVYGWESDYPDPGCWRDVSRYTDEELAELIHIDQVETARMVAELERSI